MKKLILPLFFFLLSIISMVAQECTPWFPFSEGTKFEYSFFDQKGKPSGRIAYNVKEITQSSGKYDGTIAGVFYDKKDKEVNSFEFSVTCDDGVYRADISNFINPSIKEAFGSMEVTVTGDELVIPKVLKVGESLPDASTHMEAEMGIIKMKMDMEVTNRKVLEKVSVTTPVKTFDTYKVTSDEYIKMPILSRTGQSIYYYAEGYGQVKVENYDKKGKLDSYMLLTKFEK
ncbi:MAG: hypothetical protein KDC53_08890 [Saprospiraceae bacterium]|nr:hypothetical protein [Saprospiraceae bacterium]